MDTAEHRQPWDGEIRLVREAIMLVASGMSPRVLVAGIAHGELVREACKRFALESGARLVARPTSRGDRVDVLVEAIHA
jgi:hypothetical protein